LKSRAARGGLRRRVKSRRRAASLPPYYPVFQAAIHAPPSLITPVFSIINAFHFQSIILLYHSAAKLATAQGKNFGVIAINL